MSRCLIFLYFYQTTGELAYMGDIYFVDDGEMRAFLIQKYGIYEIQQVLQDVFLE